MKDGMLEVGDELFCYGSFSNKSMFLKGKIDRVTNTLAFIGTLKLKRRLNHGSTYRTGSSGYSRQYYYIVTDDKREELEKQNTRRALIAPLISIIDSGRGGINFLSNDQLERINSILSEGKK